VTVEAGGREHRLDAVVIATHSDTALSLLADPSDDERRILGAIRYTRNHTVLHTDERFLPAARDARSSWNYRVGSCVEPAGALEATYWMNRLQGLRARRQYLVTLNPSRPIDPAAIIRRIEYAHPLYDFAAIRAQAELPRLQGVRRTWFCGAYQYYGFHEDGLRSGEEAAKGVLAAAGAAQGVAAAGAGAGAGAAGAAA
jgi:predicted NAD/FAD-binding protein